MSNTGEFRSFQVDEDPINGGYRVVFWVACYAASFGDDAYPEALSQFAGSGNTSFMILAKDENGEYLEGMDYDDALQIADEMDEEYRNVIVDCEDGADWDSWPEELAFDADDVIFYK